MTINKAAIHVRMLVVVWPRFAKELGKYLGVRFLECTGLVRLRVLSDVTTAKPSSKWSRDFAFPPRSKFPSVPDALRDGRWAFSHVFLVPIGMIILCFSSLVCLCG